MKIEKIIKLKSGNYELSVIDSNQDEKKFNISEDLLIKHNLYSNKILTNDDLTLLNTLANYSKIYTSTLNYIAFKMRSEKEVYEYLHDKECDKMFATEIVEKLKKLNYINDQIYSDSYVKYQFDHNKKGRKIIEEELIKKGIDLTIIQKSVQYITPSGIDSNINHLIKYYDKVSKNKSIRKLKETILRNLVSKGYEYDEVLRNLNHYQFEETNDDSNLIEKEFNKLLVKYQKKYQGYELKTKMLKSLMNKGFEYQDLISYFDDYDFNE